MSELINSMVKNKDASESKSYLIGLERGRVWAEDYADYFDMRQWSESDASEFEDLILPDDEGTHFKLLGAETPLIWTSYLKGWLDGVKEIVERY